MKHLYSWTSWRVNESTDSEIEDIKRANTLFGNWIFQKVVKDIKVKVNNWEIPYQAYDKNNSKGKYQVKAITATHRGKRFFIGLNAPENHRFGIEHWSKPINNAGEFGNWGAVYYLSVPPSQSYRVMAHFYIGDDKKIEEPNKWFPTASIKKITSFFTNKIPPRDYIILTDLASIVNSTFGFELVESPLGKSGFFYRKEMLIDLFHDIVKKHIAELSDEEELLQVEPQIVDIPEFFVYPYCTPKNS